MNQAVFILIGLVLGVAGGFVGYRLGLARAEAVKALLDAANSQLEQLKTSLSQSDSNLRTAREDVVRIQGDLETQKKLGEQREEAHQARLQDFAKTEQEMSDRFAALSSDVLSKTTDDLMKRASEVLDTYKKEAESDGENRKEQIEKLIEPLSKQLTELDALYEDMERRRNQQVGEVNKQLEDLMRSGEDLRKQTHSLASALHNPGQAGAWGEMVLERIIEMSGLTENVTYFSQETIKGVDGNSRPDVSIRMPGNKVVFIDSKVPLTHYLEALNVEDHLVRTQGFQVFATKVDEHVRALSKRRYSDVDEAVDFTILFLPSEAAYRTALETRPRLIEDSLALKIVIATPTSLFGVLKTIHYAWRHDSLAKDASEVRKVGAQLYANVSKLADHYRKLGKNLNSAVDAYNDFGSSLETRTLSSARRLKQLGVSDSEPIPEFEASSAATRVLTRPEFSKDLTATELTQLALVGPETGGEE